MHLSTKQNRAAIATQARPSLRSVVVVRARAKEVPSMDAVGFISNDNSGKGSVQMSVTGR